MARIRSIKLDFYKDEKVADLDPETRLLFIGLWILADRKGILEDRPRWIRAELFPYNPEFDIDTALHALARARMCVRYQADDGTPLIYIVNFLKHQRPNSREPESNRQNPTSDTLKGVACACASMHERARVEGEREGNGNGKERHARKARSAPTLTDQEFIESLKANPAYEGIDVDRELGKMDAWLLPRPGLTKTRRRIVNWLNRAEKPIGGMNAKRKSVVAEYFAERRATGQGDGEGPENIRGCLPEPKTDEGPGGGVGADVERPYAGAICEGDNEVLP